MATISFQLIGQSADLDIEVSPPAQSVTLSGGDKFEVTRTLAANDADGEIELWSSTMALTSFTQAVIEVDPMQTLATADAGKFVIIEFTTSEPTVFCLKVSRACPMVLTSNASGSTSATATRTIDRIAARNSNTTPAMDVRLVLTK